MHRVIIFVCDLHRESNEGCRCGTFRRQSRRQTNSNYRYADDTALLENSAEGIERLTTAINETGKDMNLKLNVKKTKPLVAEGEPKEYNSKIDGEDVEQVNHFKYLGSVKTATANCTADIKARIGMAKGRMIELQDIWND